MSEETHYAILGVSENATPSEIRAAYRGLLKKIHPDTVATLSPELRREAESVTKEIMEAYSVLSDARRRRVYDQSLSDRRRERTPSTSSAKSLMRVTPRPDPDPPADYSSGDMVKDVLIAAGITLSLYLLLRFFVPV